MRGIHTFNETIINQITQKPLKKGRNSELIEQRNVLLLNRYYFYANFTKTRYEAVMQLLSGEFFLAERRISDLITNDKGTLSELRRKQPDISYFRKRFPHLSWSNN